MNQEQAIIFLQALGAKKIRVKSDGWVECCCVLARWTHQKHTDNNPSFGLSVNEGNRSYFNCFACRSGSAEELLQTIEMYSKSSPQNYNFPLCRQMLEAEIGLMPLPSYTEFKGEEQVFEEWPDYWLDSFKPVYFFSDVLEYLEKRNVSIKVVNSHALRFDSKRNMIVCPYFTVYGKFAGARGRSILEDVSGPQKHWDYSWHGKNNCRLVWYNEPVLNLDGPIVVVEGQFDCWRVEQVFPKVVANLTAKPCWEKMKKLGDANFIIHIPDDDVAGRESVGAYARVCRQLGIGYKLLELKGLDPNEKLDPDKCHPEYLKTRIGELL